MNDNDINSVNRKYRSIKEAIFDDKNHIIIVGNDIVSLYKEEENEDEQDNNQEVLLKQTRIYSTISWKYFSETYSDLIIKYSQKYINIATIYDTVFNMTNLEKKLHFKEIEYNKREEDIVKKHHELFIKENGYNVKYKELQNQKKDYMYSQYVSYTLFTILTIIVNYKQIFNYLK